MIKQMTKKKICIYINCFHVFNINFFSVLSEISKLLETGLDSETLAICVKLCENGVNPEALAMVIQELRRETAAIKVRTKKNIDFCKLDHLPRFN